MSRLIETTILYGLLVVFAIWGITYGAPMIANKLESVLVKAVEVK